MSNSSKLVKTKPPAAGKGRVKGTPNKITKALKEMILGALDDVGGQAYLARQAEENPAAYMTLIGKVLPLSINADVKGELGVTIKRFTPEPDGN